MGGVRRRGEGGRTGRGGDERGKKQEEKYTRAKLSEQSLPYDRLVPCMNATCVGRERVSL